MRVKCIKTSIDKADSSITNSDMREYLSINSLFWVFGVRLFRNITYVYIFDGNHLFEVPIELFEIIDDNVSSEWKIKVWEVGEVTLWPDLFYEEKFLENFAERENDERRFFEDLRKRIEKK